MQKERQSGMESGAGGSGEGGAKAASGHEQAASLSDTLYLRMRGLAVAHLNGERSACLTPTELVHEAWLRVGDLVVQDRVHFLRLAGEAMRRVLVDQARERLAQKRGGDLVRVSLRWVGSGPGLEFSDEELLDLDRALDELARQHARTAEVMLLRCFSGLGLQDIAKLNGTSLATVKRDWSFGRAWLLASLEGRRR